MSFNSEDSESNFDKKLEKAKKKLERRQKKEFKKEKRREWRQKTRNRIKVKVVKIVTVTKDGLIIVISFFFQKEIILASTIFISSWVTYKQSEKLYDELTEQKVLLAKIETQLNVQNNQQSKISVLKNFITRVDWIKLGIGLFFLMQKLQHHYEKQATLRELTHAYSTAGEAKLQIQNARTALNERVEKLTEEKQVTTDLRKQLKKQELEKQEVQTQLRNWKIACEKSSTKVLKKSELISGLRSQIENSKRNQFMYEKKIEQLTDKLKKVNLDKRASSNFRATLQNELNLSKKELFNLKVENTQLLNKLEEVIASSLDLTGVSQKQSAKIKDLELGLEINKKKNASLNSKINELNYELKRVNDLLKLSRNLGQQEKINLENQKNNLMSSVFNTDKQLKDLQNQNKYLIRVRSQFKDEKFQSEKLNSNLIQKIEFLTDQLNQKINKESGRKRYIKKLESVITNCNLKIKNLNSKLIYLTENKEITKKDLSEIISREKNLEIKLAKIRYDLSLSETNLAEMRKKLKEAEIIRDQKVSENVQLTDKISFLEKEISNKKKIINDLQSQLDKYDYSILTFNSQSSRGRNLKNIESESKRKKSSFSTLFTGFDGQMTPTHGFDRARTPLEREMRWEDVAKPRDKKSFFQTIFFKKNNV